MKKWIFSLVIVLFLPLTLAAKEVVSLGLMPNVSRIAYKNSTFKKEASQVGVYGYAGIGLYHMFELGADQTSVTYNEIFATPELQQQDYTLRYTSYWIPAVKLVLGVHLVQTDDAATDQGKILFAGLNYYAPFAWNFGVDVYRSQYPDYKSDQTTSSITPELVMTQITPTLGINFGKGMFYSETRAFFISGAIDKTSSNVKSYSSIQESLFFYYKKLTVNIKAWSGKQVFAVRSDGFVVFNTSEEHLGGSTLSVGWKLSQSLAVTLASSREYFEDVVDQRKVTAETTTLSVGFTF